MHPSAQMRIYQSDTVQSKLCSRNSWETVQLVISRASSSKFKVGGAYSGIKQSLEFNVTMLCTYVLCQEVALSHSNALVSFEILSLTSTSGLCQKAYSHNQ